MALNSVRHPDGAIGRLSRRSVLKGVTALTAAAASAPWMPASAWCATILAYVGTYSNHGEAIYLFSVDTSTGALAKIKVFPSVVNPSWLAFTPDRLGHLVRRQSIERRSYSPQYGDLGRRRSCAPRKAPPGSFALSGHDAPHAHMIHADPAGNYVIANDLGLDLTIVWILDRTTGKLIDHQKVPSSAGAGPRYFAFHPNGKWFYSINEEASTLAFMTYDAATGTLTPVQEISTLPHIFVGTNFTSEVIVSADGHFVYAANRLHDSVAVFAVRDTGRLRHVGEAWTRGDYPRNVNIDPTGRFLYACNHRSDSITAFSIDGATGDLTFNRQSTAVGSLPVR